MLNENNSILFNNRLHLSRLQKKTERFMVKAKAVTKPIAAMGVVPVRESAYTENGVTEAG